MIYTGTYSCQDNKLRLYASTRLDAETYARVKAAGFIWAPKQGLFVAPAWSPSREDVLFDLCGEIGDEDTTTEERAAERSDRFDQYAEHRERDAEAAQRGVHAIADGIPFGQPILVGHHSEKRARKDAERIQNGMRKAVKMWETSAYWLSRAEASIAAAAYKERPDVRVRRIKGLEAEERKFKRELAHAEHCLRFWKGELKRKDGQPFELTRETALAFCNTEENLSFEYPLSRYPRNPPASQYEGRQSLWGALGGSDGPECAIISPDQARDLALGAHEHAAAHYRRWISHTQNRLAYEKAMLPDYKAPERKKSVKQTLPLLNYRAASIIAENPYRRGETYTMEVVEMTKAAWAKIPTDYKGTRIVNGTHRYRIALAGGGVYRGVFLTDSLIHKEAL